MARAYYGSRIGPNMTKTPEGYLICLNAPIARTGEQEYLGQEISSEFPHDQVVIAVREPEEVFDPATIASFEGKPVTDEHPGKLITVDTVIDKLKGSVQNVRQGQGEESDLLLADLIIYDSLLIHQIESGKRELSCGYDVTYLERPDGKFSQKNIRGNHVAVVNSGRAGPRVTIKDNKPPERSSKMKKSSLWGRLISSYAKDASPEEVAEAVDMMRAEEGEEKAPETPPVSQPAQDEDKLDIVIKMLGELGNAIMASAKPEAKAPPTPDALDELEAELKQGGMDESLEAQEPSVTVEPEVITDSGELNETVAADRMVFLNHIAAAKPIIAGIKDSKQRQFLAKVVADSIRVQSTVSNGYNTIQAAATDNCRQGVLDSANDGRELGRQWAKKYNPHYKEN